jgi:hypothetical protein
MLQHISLSLFIFVTVRIQFPHINSKRVRMVVEMISIPAIPHLFRAVIHLPDMVKLKDMGIRRVNVFVIPMEAGA